MARKKNVDMQRNDWLTMDEAAELMRVSRRIMLRAVRNGCPCRLVGREWRLSRAGIDKWLAEGQDGQYAAEM